MTRVRKKPVEVEARHFNDEDLGEELARWCHGHFTRVVNEPKDNFQDYPTAIAIYTKEGTMYATLGDWIICGVAGEFYPCKQDIFDATYELV